MINETTFQVLSIFTTVAFVILWGRNLLSTDITSDKFYTAMEGPIIAVPCFLLLGASLAGTLVYSINPQSMKWSVFPLPFWLRGFGFFIGLVALTIFPGYSDRWDRTLAPHLAIWLAIAHYRTAWEHNKRIDYEQAP